MSTPEWIKDAERSLKGEHGDCFIELWQADLPAIARCVQVAKAACEYVEHWNYDGHDDKDTREKFNALHSAIVGEDA